MKIGRDFHIKVLTILLTVASRQAAGQARMNMEQTLSDQAQGMTIAFDGLAFLTGSVGADSFLPPGKVADFSGFQYLRDNDPTGLGHKESGEASSVGVEINGEAMEAVSVGMLGKRQSRTILFLGLVNESGTSPFVVTAPADCFDETPELDESNNCKSKTVRSKAEGPQGLDEW